ncbi:MAG: hypothetical protein NTV34_12325, partial [Proteobacteria bacterium]|nr:hypothetical protein [Pseudomonadota bacterium]
FASTFFSFNAEYLVHLCGVESERKKIIRRAMISAVGTTLIGLVVLLGSSSSLIREMAVAAIAGLVGFFVGTIPFASLLASIRFVSTPRLRNFVGFRFLKHFNFRIPSVLKKLFGSLKWWSLLAAICLLVIPFSGWPPVRTDVSQFRFAPDLLETAEKHFSSLLSDDLSFYAIPSQDLPKIGHDFEASVYRSAEIVSKDFHGSMKSVKSFATDVAMQLGRVGFDLDAETLLEPYHLDEDAANAEVWRASSIFAGSMFLGAGSWSVITASSKETEGWLQSGQRLFKMDVRSYYNDLLTDQSLSMLGLFAFGFCGMIAYLAIVQRSLRKVIVIVMPLIVFFLAGSAVLSVFRIPLNIIHGIGLVLVIGFALDYTAIAVSTAFSSPDMSKILITGASTIASFCGLCFAEHPFLQMLGFVVVPGVFLSLFFALAIDKFEVGQFLNRPKGGICGSVLPVLCLLSILLVGCVTPKVLKLSSGLEYGHPKNFVAEQSVCVLAKGQRTCFLGELSRKDSEFSLAILEPTMLSLLLVAESPAEHEVHAEIRSKYEFLDRIDPKFIMDTIRQLHEKSNLVLNRGVVLLNIPGGSNISVAYQWGEVVRAGCPYPEDLRLDFPKIGNAPPLSLLVTNTKVVCDVTKSGDRL